MTVNWSQEKCDAMTPVELEGERLLHIHPEAIVQGPTPPIDHSLTNHAERESSPAAGPTQRTMWFIGWDVTLAAIAGVLIFSLLNVASVGVLGSAVTAAGVVAAVGLGHYLLWGRAFARGVARERQRAQDQARGWENGETGPPDEFLLGLNGRERRELLWLLERSLAEPPGGREERGNSVTIRRELHHKIRMFDA